MSNMKKIILHGYLNDLYSKPIQVEAATVAEALRSLEMIQELKPEFGEPHQITVVGIETEIALYAETDRPEIHVHPRMGGAGGEDGGLTQILLGIVMIAVGIAFPGIAILGITQTALFISGGLMIMGGLLQAITPTPEAEETSRQLGSGKNSVKLGTRIPLAYGNVKLEGHYLSFDMDAVDWAANDAVSGNVTGFAWQNAWATIRGVTPLPPAGTPPPEYVDGPVNLDVAESLFVEHDKTPVQTAMVNPVYPLATASPTNFPTSTWIT